MGEVFLSYAREDAAAAERLAQALEDGGLGVWWDRRLHGGSEYSADIERALRAADAVLVLWSKHAAASAWVRDEAESGRDAGKLIPLSLDGTPPPIGFRQYHTIALQDWARTGNGGLPPTLDAAIAAKLNQPGREASGPAAAPREQEVRFCKAPDGVNLAYSIIGDGPPLVKAANWMNHLEYEFESPLWRHMVEELSRAHRLLRYDERGNGMSDWHVEDLSFEAMVQDLETVVDAAGFERFDLLGISQGVPVAIAFATRHPERVKRLVLFAGFAVGWCFAKDPQVVATWQAMATVARTGWGKDNPAFRQMFTSLAAPDVTREETAAFNDLQRISASPEAAERLMGVLGSIDVRALLPQVQVPTMVLHCRGDAFVPFEFGRKIAARIPGARFVALDSNNHLLSSHEPAWARFQQHVRGFLGD